MNIKDKINSLKEEISRLEKLDLNSTSLHDWCINFGMNPPRLGVDCYYKRSVDDNWEFGVFIPDAENPGWEVCFTHNESGVDVICKSFDTPEECLAYLQQMPPLTKKRGEIVIHCWAEWHEKEGIDHLIYDKLQEIELSDIKDVTYTDIPIEWKLPNKSQ